MFESKFREGDELKVEDTALYNLDQALKIKSRELEDSRRAMRSYIRHLKTNSDNELRIMEQIKTLEDAIKTLEPVEE